MARSSLSSHFGARLRKLRTERGLSQATLAERIGISANHLGIIERGESSPTLETVEAIADALMVDPALLVTTEACADPWFASASLVLAAVQPRHHDLVSKLLAAFVEDPDPRPAARPSRRPRPRVRRHE